MSQFTKQNSPKAVPYGFLHAGLLSFVCLTLLVFALAAAAHIPAHVAAGDYIRLVGVILFNLLVLVALADNIHTHFLVWQKHKKPTVPKVEMAPELGA